jgi:melanoma-associated antigen
MGSKSRQFNVVFARAQGILSQTLGMELVELQNRVQEQDESNDKDGKDGKSNKKEKKDAVGMKKKGMHFPL